MVLCAGAGTRLAPLTRYRPKVLCPVGNRALLDLALDRFAGALPPGGVAVNAHHHCQLIEAHLETRPAPDGSPTGPGRPHLSVEQPVALGTAGALGQLRGWLDGRAVLVANGDTYCDVPMATLLAGWDGETVRVLSPTPGSFGPRSEVAGTLLPPWAIATLEAQPSGLYERCWRTAQQDGRLEVLDLPAGSSLIDCGTPRRYLAANLACSGGASVVAPEAEVAIGAIVDSSVVWPGTTVGPAEVLRSAVRADHGMTVYVRDAAAP